MANDILIRLKELLGYRTDIELSLFLGVTPQTISQWKKRDTLDYDLLINKLPKDIDLNYIFRGTALPNDKVLETEYEKAVNVNKNILNVNEILGEEIVSKNKEIIKLEAKIEILQETIMKMNTFYTQDQEEEMSGMSVRKVADNIVEYK